MKSQWDFGELFAVEKVKARKIFSVSELTG